MKISGLKLMNFLRFHLIIVEAIYKSIKEGGKRVNLDLGSMGLV